MKLWAMPCRDTQEGWSWCRVLAKRDPLGKGMANYFNILAFRTPWTVWKGQKNRTLKDKLSRLVGAPYATGDWWRNNSKNEEMEPKQKQYPVVDMTGDGSNVQCCKEQYCIGTWNVRPMNQGKLEVVKRDGKSENQHFRNQQTKMERNGWI